MGEALNCSDPEFIDFLHQCFIWDPKERITPEKALKHKWIIEDLSNKENDVKLDKPEDEKLSDKIQMHYATNRENKTEKIELNKTLTYSKNILQSIGENKEPNKPEDKILKFKESSKLAQKRRGNDEGNIVLKGLFNKEKNQNILSNKNKNI